jgi:hypothetical protein
MFRKRSALLAIAAAAATTFATSATAQAACTSASPTGTTYYDSGDAEPGAPEIGTVLLSVEATCGVVVDPGIARSLTEDDAVMVYIDGDANRATGDPELDGADVVVATIGTAAPVRGVWDGDGFTFDAGPIGPAVGNGGFRSTVDALPLTLGVEARFLVVALTAVGDEIYADGAPGLGSARIQLSVHAPSPPPVATRPIVRPIISLPPRQRTLPRPAPAPKKVTAELTQKRCAVPRTKGLTVAAAKVRLTTAGCAFAPATKRSYSPTVRKGRVVGTTVPAGRTSASAFRLIVSKGKRPR